MKIIVKTLKGTSFEIDVSPEDKITDVKRTIESSQGQNVYPADQQMLIFQGKILKDDTTLEENKVVESSFIVIMLSKAKPTPTAGASSGTSAAAKPTAPPPTTASVATTASVMPTPTLGLAPEGVEPLVTAATSVPAPVVAPTGVAGVGDVYGQAASNLVSGSSLEQTIQQILDMGDGSWDRETVVRALRAAFNNPERAVEYLYSGIPENAVEAPQATQAPVGQQLVPEGHQPPAPAVPSSTPAVPAAGPNVNPLDLFPQGLPAAGAGAGAGAGSLDLLRNSPQFRAMLALVQANPQILQPILQELGKSNPQILRLIQENQAEFLRLVNEPPEGGAEGNILGQLQAAMPQAIQVTQDEREAIERLEAMGFDRDLVLQVYFACNKNEELAANYLLDHMNEFEEQ